MACVTSIDIDADRACLSRQLRLARERQCHEFWCEASREIDRLLDQRLQLLRR